ncbi:Hsp70 family protein [Nocardia sp. alder85J]|uniref:Hsp70 family protein n=1 Tax=Nocardia sp. alder85J TaxID=2862949 RepID=UPI001CD3BEF4|nr:Hsp70 family protein [Nocardia sp. alder85J]MCX4093058.1 Hsp70 family protein [Nocardia sp. alder85J]
MTGVDPSGWLCVDIGTDNTAAATGYGPGGEPKTLPLTDSGEFLPAAVFVHSSTAMEVGAEALRRARTVRDGVVIDLKQRIVRGENSFEVGWSSVSLRAAIAALLRAVIARAQVVAQRPVTGVVLTYPQLWSPPQVQILAGAARDIGLPEHRIRTVPEPLAAVRFHQRTSPVAPGRRVAVVDFGSGSLDVAVLMAAADGSFPLLAARSDESLNVAALDTAIRHWIADRLRDLDSEVAESLGADSEADDPSFAATIRLARQRLTTATGATLVISADGEDEKITLTRAEFDTLARPFVARIGDLVQETLELAGVRGRDDLHAVYPTGGGTRIPIVQHRLQSFGRIERDSEPETVTARGALWHPELAAGALSIAGPPAITSRAPDSTGRTDTLRRLPPLPVWQADTAGPPTAELDIDTTPAQLKQVLANRPPPAGRSRTIPILVAVVVALLAAAGIAGFAATRTRHLAGSVTGTAAAPTVLTPAAPAIRATVPIGNNPIDVAVRSGSAYVLGADSTIWIVDLRSRALRTVAPLGRYPAALVTDSRYVYVTATDRQGHGSVLVVDGSTGALQATVPVGPDARHLAVDPDRHTVYVTTSDDRDADLVALDTTTRAVTGRLHLAAGARDLAINPFTHTLYVLPAPGGDPAVRVVDGATLTLSGTIPAPGGATGLAVNPNVHTLYLTTTGDSTTAGVIVLDTTSGTVTTTVRTGPPGTRAALDPGNHTAYLAIADPAAARLAVVDTVSENVTATIPLTAAATAVAVDPSDHAAYAVGNGSLWIIGS